MILFQHLEGMSGSLFFNYHIYKQLAKGCPD